MSTAIEFNNVSKQYKLGLVSTKTLSHDLNRWWQTKILGKEDPYLKIGSVNDRSAKADSDYVWALKDIDFKVEQGDVVGIIGKNGAGKSTLLKLLSRVTNPTTGTIRAKGRIASLLEVGTGFHPEMTGRENIYMNGSIMGMTKSEITRKLDEIVDFSGCERYIDTPVKRYSSGMTVRLGFAIAAHLDPEILVVDEVLAVGDAEFQKKAIGKMQDVSKGEGRTVLFVSHNMASIKQLCRTGVLLKNGMVSYLGNIEECVELYLRGNTYSEIPKLVEFIKNESSLLVVNDIKVNGSTLNQLTINKTGQRIDFLISGICNVQSKVAFEVLIKDANHTVLASYTPTFTTMELIDLKEGNFTIRESFMLPLNMSSGEYFIEWYITHPNVAYLSYCKEPIRLCVENISFPDGSPFCCNTKGFISLNNLI